jgi:DNA-binding PadR family transcriptional regulator
MLLQKDDTAWLQRGRQRAAVARVLRKPMTGTEICAAARGFNSHIQLRDVWHLLRQMERRGLVQCFNPRLVTGRLYLVTPKGRAAVQKTFAILVPKPPASIDWRKYSRVVRAKIRRLTLVSLSQLEEKTGGPQTATAIRKHLERSVNLNLVIRAIKDLLKLGLFQVAGVTGKRQWKLYRLTQMGRNILDQLNR